MASIGVALLVAGFKFCAVIIAVYIGVTLALRGFFGRGTYDPRTGERVGETGERIDGGDAGDESGDDVESDRHGD